MWAIVPQHAAMRHFASVIFYCNNSYIARLTAYGREETQSRHGDAPGYLRLQ